MKIKMNLICICILMFLFSSAAISWDGEVKTDEMTDIKIGYVTDFAISEKSVWGKMPSAIVRCQSNRSIDIFIQWEDYIGGDLSQVEYRFDKRQAVTEEFHLSTTGKATFVPNQTVDYFLSKMKKHNILLLRVKDYEGTKKPIAKFLLKGFTVAYNKACKWWDILKANKERVEAKKQLKAEAEEVERLLGIKNEMNYLKNTADGYKVNWPIKLFEKLKEFDNCATEDATYSINKRVEYCAMLQSRYIAEVWKDYHPLFKKQLSE